MNPKIKAKWLRALRGGKYKQARHALHDTTGFCCLGVLCDIHRKETKGEWKLRKEGGLFFYRSAKEILPRVVAKWAGLKYLAPKAGHSNLAAINDDGVSFLDIAKLIEDSL